MRLLALATSLAGLLCATVPVSADPKPIPPIKYWTPKEKDRIKIDVTETTTTRITVNGKPEPELTITNELKYIEDYIELTPDVEIKRYYIAATKKHKDKSSHLHIQSNTEPVSIKKDKKKDAKYEFFFKGKRPDDESYELLNNEFNLRPKYNLRSLILSGPLKTDTEYPLDIGKIREILNESNIQYDPVDPVRGTMKVTNPETNDKKLTGAIEINILAPIIVRFDEKNKVEASGTLQFVFKGDGYLDGTSPVSNANLTITFTVKDALIGGVKTDIFKEVKEVRKITLAPEKDKK